MSNYTYHGSIKKFEIGQPKYTARIKMIKKNGKEELFTKYEGVSFHVTTEKYMALSYLKKKKYFFYHKKKRYQYTSGIDLYKKNKTIWVYGKNNLEYTLKKLYKPGYLYIFDKKDFQKTDGLGKYELLSFEPIKPIKRIYIKDPIKELKKLGIKFKFIDLLKN